MTDADTLVETPSAPAAASPEGASPAERRRLRLLAHRVTGSSRERLLESFPCEIVDDHETSEDVDLIVVSTRMPLGQVSGALVATRRMRVPVVAIVHAGGEDLATELLRAGAAGLVAEGNEAAIASFAGERPLDASLVETYEQRLGRARPSDIGSPGRDPATGLPTRGDFEATLTEATQAGEVPRVGFVRVTNHDESIRRLSDEATNLLRRRLAAQFREIGRMHGAEVFSWSPSMYTFVSVRLGSTAAAEMGRLMIDAAETFAPSGGRPLTLAVGHAGAEVTSEVSAVRELAQRAMELAGTSSESAVLSADDLSRTLAATTELEVLLRLVHVVERQTGREGHGARVGHLAAVLARHLGFDGIERSSIRLAGHLHEIGKISLDPAAASGGADDDTYRRYPTLGAEYLQVSAGPEVAQAVRHHAERWDGTGFPDGLAREAIPIGARIIAVARGLAELPEDVDGVPEGLDTVLDDADVAYDPTVIGAVRAMYDQAGGSQPGLPPLMVRSA